MGLCWLQVPGPCRGKLLRLLLLVWLLRVHDWGSCRRARSACEGVGCTVLVLQQHNSPRVLSTLAAQLTSAGAAAGECRSQVRLQLPVGCQRRLDASHPVLVLLQESPPVRLGILQQSLVPLDAGVQALELLCQ